MSDSEQRKFHLFTIASCLLIAAGIAVMAASLYRAQRSILEQERRQMLVVARSTASSIDNYVQGCLVGTRMIQGTGYFRDAVRQYRATGDADAMRDIMTVLADDGHPALRDVYLLNPNGARLAGTAELDAYVAISNGLGFAGDGKLRVYKNRDNAIFLGVITKMDEENYILNLMDANLLYQNTTSFVSLGEKGYVMLKHSDGLILTHPVEEQVGSDVLLGRRERYPNLDYSDLERLIRHQKQGRESVEIYHSYWWADEKPTRVRKISAYTPVFIENDFLIVSAVADYAELWRPVFWSSTALAIAAILVTLGVMGILFHRRRENQLQIQRENVYLKELNRSMDEMNRRQEEMQHNQRLQLIGTLTGGIAHEFRNLLTPIMGYSGLLRETLPPDSPIREDINEIYTSAVRAKEIIQQITSLSRKNLDPAFRPLRMDEVMPRILKVADSTKPAGASMEMDVDFGGAEIMGNKTQLNQIVLNLCNNAFQALPDGTGRLQVAGRTVRENGVEYAVLTFTDNGEGIEPEVLERIFDPFFTTKRVGEGTGLGLSVVQNIVDLHQGAIGVDTRPGHGTTFTVRFPTIAAETAEKKKPAETTKTAEEPVSIVLVEDDEQILRLLHRGLAKSGFATQAFSDPLEALKEIEQNPCRLLITDYNLPRMTGGELAMRVRGGDSNIKIIILTGFADVDLLEYMQKDIIDGYQIKPVPVSELVEKINALFAQ